MILRSRDSGILLGFGIVPGFHRAGGRTAGARRNLRGGASDVGALRPVAQCVVHEHDQHHGFSHGHGPNADTRVMTTFGRYQRGMTRLVDGSPRDAYAGGWLDGDGDFDVLARGNAAKNTAGMIAEKAGG